MKKARITVLKTTFQEDPVAEYGAEDIGRCPKHREGRTFMTDGAKLDGLCDGAWEAMRKYVVALGSGAGPFYNGRWMRGPGIAIVSCSDGLRSVIFKVEATDEDSDTDHIPVRRSEYPFSPP